MNEYRKGDRVKVVIENAKFVEQSSTYDATIEIKCLLDCWHQITIPLDNPDITVTHIAEQPQAGDTWRLTDQSPWQIKTSLSEKLIANHVYTLISRPIHELDFTGAELLFRLDAETPAETPTLRRVRDSDGHTWTETNLNTWRWDASSNCRETPLYLTAKELDDEYGPLTDLDAIPATQ